MTQDVGSVIKDIDTDTDRKHRGERQHCDKKKKYMADPKEKGIQDERGVDKNTARSRNNVAVTQGFSK